VRPGGPDRPLAMGDADETTTVRPYLVLGPEHHLVLCEANIAVGATVTGPRADEGARHAWWRRASTRRAWSR
jgi:hypothetical protein